MPEPLKRLCVRCKMPLSSYNKTNECFHHPEELVWEDEGPNKYFRTTDFLVKNHALKNGGAEKKITPETIIQIVGEVYGVSRKLLLDHNRKAKIAWARQTIMYLLRTDLKCSFPLIAMVLKRRDHTTVFHGCRKVASAIEKDVEINTVIQKIRSLYPENLGDPKNI